MPGQKADIFKRIVQLNTKPKIFNIRVFTEGQLLNIEYRDFKEAFLIFPALH